MVLAPAFDNGLTKWVGGKEKKTTDTRSEGLGDIDRQSKSVSVSESVSDSR